MIVKTEALVLKSIDLRETSKIVTFYTREFGKVKGVLKGIRKDHRKFGSSVDRFSLNDIVFYQYRNSDLHLVSHCDMKEFYGGLRADIKKMNAASYATELIDVIMAPEEKNEEIYELVTEFLRTLQTTADVSKLVHMFQIKVLGFSGFRPHLDSCVKCNQKVLGQSRFSMQLGGLVCRSCEVSEATLTPISRGAVASLIHIEQNSWQRNMRLALSAPIRRELKFVLNNFLVFNLERHLKSTRYLS